MKALKIMKSDGEFMECPESSFFRNHFNANGINSQYHYHAIWQFRLAPFNIAAVIYLDEAKSERNHT